MLHRMVGICLPRLEQISYGAANPWPRVRGHLCRQAPVQRVHCGGVMGYTRENEGVTGARPEASRPRLLDEVRRCLRVKHYSLRTEQAYMAWIRRLIYRLRWRASFRAPDATLAGSSCLRRCSARAIRLMG